MAWNARRCRHNRFLPQWWIETSWMWSYSFAKHGWKINNEFLRSCSCMAILSGDSQESKSFPCNPLQFLGRFLKQWNLLQKRHCLHGIWCWFEVSWSKKMLQVHIVKVILITVHLANTTWKPLPTCSDFQRVKLASCTQDTLKDAWVHQIQLSHHKKRVKATKTSMINFISELTVTRMIESSFRSITKLSASWNKFLWQRKTFWLELFCLANHLWKVNSLVSFKSSIFLKSSNFLSKVLQKAHPKALKKLKN